MTNSNLMLFTYDNLVIHSNLINDEPWFLAKEICSALGYKRAAKAVLDHCYVDDVLKQDIIDRLGRPQKASWINESGVYALIFGSKLPSAEKFKNWVTHEVLPSIRKTGKYEVKSAATEPVTSEQIIKVCEFTHRPFKDSDNSVKLPILILEDKVLFRMQPVLAALHINWQSPLIRTLNQEEIYRIPYGKELVKFVTIDNLFRLIFSSRVAWSHEFQEWIMYFVLPRLPHTKPFNMHMDEISVKEKEFYQLEQEKGLKFLDKELIARPDSQYEKNFQVDLEAIAIKAERDALHAGLFAGVLFKGYENDIPRLTRLEQQIRKVIDHMTPEKKSDFERGFKASAKNISMQDLEPNIIDEE